METEVKRSAVIEVEESAALGLRICGIQRKLLMAALAQKWSITCVSAYLCVYVYRLYKVHNNFFLHLWRNYGVNGNVNA